jgi:hypothetical protein
LDVWTWENKLAFKEKKWKSMDMRKTKFVFKEKNGK